MGFLWDLDVGGFDSGVEVEGGHAPSLLPQIGSVSILLSEILALSLNNLFFGQVNLDMLDRKPHAVGEVALVVPEGALLLDLGLVDDVVPEYFRF